MKEKWNKDIEEEEEKKKYSFIFSIPQRSYSFSENSPMNNLLKAVSLVFLVVVVLLGLCLVVLRAYPGLCTQESLLMVLD